MPKVKAPSTLGKAGKALWVSVTDVYSLRADELAVLEDACAATDMIAALNERWMADGAPSLTRGSMGQEVIHPMIGEIRAQRAFRDQALARLKLPDESASGSESDTSSKARAAAVARWTRGA